MQLVSTGFDNSIALWVVIQRCVRGKCCLLTRLTNPCMFSLQSGYLFLIMRCNSKNIQLLITSCLTGLSKLFIWRKIPLMYKINLRWVNKRNYGALCSSCCLLCHFNAGLCLSNCAQIYSGVLSEQQDKRWRSERKQTRQDKQSRCTLLWWNFRLCLPHLRRKETMRLTEDTILIRNIEAITNTYFKLALGRSLKNWISLIVHI